MSGSILLLRNNFDMTGFHCWEKCCAPISAAGNITKTVLMQLHNEETVHSNKGIVKENQLAYDHFVVWIG